MRPLFTILLVLFAWTALPVPGLTAVTRVSVATGGMQGNGDSYRLVFSGDGRYVAYVSESDNLELGDTNLYNDVFLRDTLAGTTELVSRNSMGIQGNAHSGMDPFTIGSYPAMSYDARYVAFYSAATNLVPGDTNGVADIFYRDRLLGTTRRISVANDGTQGDAFSLHPWMSYDGRFVCFSSDATNLVPGDTNNQTDVFVYDLQNSTIERVSVSSGGGQVDSYSLEPTISGDGRYVAFHSDAHNMVPGCVDGWWDIYVHDRVTHVTECVSMDSAGHEANLYCATPRISADGRYVAFNTGATNLISVPDTNGNLADINVVDRVTHTVELANVNDFGVQSNLDAFWSGISGDGRYVSYCSFSDNLTPFATNPNILNIFAYDRSSRRVSLISANPTGYGGNWNCDCPVMSPDGDCVGFQSQATDLVVGDYNNRWDAFTSCGWTQSLLPVPPPSEPSEFWVTRNSFRPGTESDVVIGIACRTPGPLSVKIYNTAGELIKVLLDKIVNTGNWFQEIAWDGKNEKGEWVASGVYLVHYEDSVAAKSKLLAIIR